MLRHPADAFTAQFIGQEPELKRLGRHNVGDFMRPGTPEPSLAGAERVGHTSSARSALSKLLGGQAALVVVDASGAAVGQVSLNDFAALA